MVRTRTREAFPGWERSVRRGGLKRPARKTQLSIIRSFFCPVLRRCHAAMGRSRRLGPVPEHAMPVGELFSAAPWTRPRNATAASGRTGTGPTAPVREPQCYGRALACQPASDLLLHGSLQVRTTFPNGSSQPIAASASDCCGPGLLRTWIGANPDCREPRGAPEGPGRQGLRSAGLRRNTVPVRPARSAGTVDLIRCRGLGAAGCAHVDLCSRTAPFRRQPEP